MTDKLICICEKSFSCKQSICVHRKKCKQYQEHLGNNKIVIVSNNSNDDLQKRIEILEAENKLLKEANLNLINSITNLTSNMCFTNNNQKQSRENVFSIEDFKTAHKDNKNVEQFKDIVGSKMEVSNLMVVKVNYARSGDADRNNSIDFVKFVLEKSFKENKNILPFYCKDLKRKTFCLKKNDLWVDCDFDEFKNVIDSYSKRVINVGFTLLTQNKIIEKGGNEYYIHFEENKKEKANLIMISLFTERKDENKEHIANHLLKFIRIIK